MITDYEIFIATCKQIVRDKINYYKTNERNYQTMITRTSYKTLDHLLAVKLKTGTITNITPNEIKINPEQLPDAKTFIHDAVNTLNKYNSH